MKRKPQIGETLYSLNIGNAARYREQKLTPMVVTAVGRKYFSLKQEGWNITVDFHLDTWRQKTEYCQDHRLYETEQEWLNEKEEEKICQFLESSFRNGQNLLKVSLDDLRVVKDILSKYENNS